MNAEHVTSLVRVIDPRYPSNRLVLIGAVVAGLAVGAAALLGADPKAGPIVVAVGVFLAWAITRELDPDHPASAAIAIPVSFALSLTIGPSALLVSTAVLLGLRLTAGTVGTPLRLLDIVGIVGLSAALGTGLTGAVGVAVIAVGIVVSEGHQRRGFAIAAAAAIAFASVAAVTGIERTWITPTTAEWVAFGLAVAATVLIVPARTPMSETDRRTGAVGRNRVTVARFAAGLAMLLVLGLTGGVGIAALAGTTTAALTGTAIRRSVGHFA